MGPKKERTAEQKAESARKGAITKARNKATKNATATSRGSSSASSAFLPAASEGTQDPEISENTSQVIKHLEEKFGIKFTTPPGVTNVREWAERYVDDQNTTQSDLVVICDEYAVVTTAAQGLQFQQDLRPNVGAITRELIEVSKLDGFVIGRDVYGLRGYTNYRFSQKNERMPESIKQMDPKLYNKLNSFREAIFLSNHGKRLDLQVNMFQPPNTMLVNGTGSISNSDESILYSCTHRSYYWKVNGEVISGRFGDEDD